MHLLLSCLLVGLPVEFIHICLPALWGEVAFHCRLIYTLFTSTSFKHLSFSSSFAF